MNRNFVNRLGSVRGEVAVTSRIVMDALPPIWTLGAAAISAEVVDPTEMKFYSPAMPEGTATGSRGATESRQKVAGTCCTT